ncbi:DUF448 domain-containing protein [Thermosulfuriphilus ammonigenes]|uniref:DUF448 domain-containing protein n=1 Tax=Thermosulfuriphilus ammonigenes TaxID=1936021 RepID=A0A6G7PV98_9BACT|nr:DUF448 domain-containing protein [Thermosulfuriphilus ammonigenes]MBA2848228.1 putative RNA-binding protein YlxR (DUF448 family) [Thermosulfuriphilus ammonigenes]QIJ71605.1 DUF448 domain-containing protein [Thermosulfuriphilus ammonigenes]HFB83949.1 DUF448 domain-containing protein [Thermodesulfatator sp.]
MEKRQPIRMCIFCRDRQAKGSLMRLVFNQGLVLGDHRQTLPGRGAYVCSACRKRLFSQKGRKVLARAFRLSPEAIKDIRA